MFLLVGLGNIGIQYQNTRHNFGFLLLDKIIKDYNFIKLSTRKSSSEVLSGTIDNNKIIAIKPQNYMNNSGSAVLETMSFYKIPIKNIIIFHDELDLPLGKIRIKIGGSSAGHNGLKNIDHLVGNQYLRIRLGIDRPQNKNFNIADYVLQKFSLAELELVEEVNSKVSFLLPKLLAGNYDDFMNKFTTQKL